MPAWTREPDVSFAQGLVGYAPLRTPPRCDALWIEQIARVLFEHEKRARPRGHDEEHHGRSTRSTKKTASKLPHPGSPQAREVRRRSRSVRTEHFLDMMVDGEEGRHSVSGVLAIGTTRDPTAKRTDRDRDRNPGPRARQQAQRAGRGCLAVSVRRKERHRAVPGVEPHEHENARLHGARRVRYARPPIQMTIQSRRSARHDCNLDPRCPPIA